MLCVAFVISLFLLHVYYLMTSSSYKSKSNEMKIDICFFTIYKHMPFLFLFTSAHTILKHFCILRPKHSSILLWFLDETVHFNILLACYYVLGKYITLCLAVTTELSFVEAFVLLCIIQSEENFFNGVRVRFIKNKKCCWVFI